MSVITNVTADITGIDVISRQTSTAGIGRNFTTVVTLSDLSILDQLQNNGVTVHQVKGDGRVWVPILDSEPGTPVNGDIWLYQDISLGTTLNIQTPSGVLTISASGVAGTGITYTATTALLIGMAVYLDPTNGPLYASTVVDSTFAYRPRGVVKSSATMGNPVELITDGEEMSLADWTLIIGSASLTQGANYFLTATPGRYSTTPGSGVTSRVGYAATPNILVVQTGQNVVGTP